MMLADASDAHERRRRWFQALALGLVGASLAFIILAYGLLATRAALDAAIARQTDVRQAQTLADGALKLQLDEETGIRGYVNTGDRTFLEPYLRALAPLEADLHQLVASLSQRPNEAAAARAAADALATHERWQRDTNERLLPSRKTARYPAVARYEKTLMDRYRADLRAVGGAVAAELVSGRSEIEASIARLGSFALLALSIAVAAVVLVAWRDARAASLMWAAARLGDFRSLSEAFERMVWTARPDGAFDFCGERWTAYTGLEQARLLGDGWQAVVHPGDLAASTRSWRLSVETGTPLDHQSRLRRADGEYRWHRSRALPLRNRRGEITAWVGEAIDVHDEHTRLDHLRERYETEKRISDTLQKALLTDALPSVPGLVLDAVYRPAGLEARVGGDWYDAFVLPGGHVLFSVGDVAGHGLEAAIAMNQARQVIIATALQEDAPERILARANATLKLQNAPIVTALCGIIDPQTGEGSYASAGHPPPLVATPDGRVEALELGGLPLTSKPEIAYRRHPFQLADGALFVVHTDGAVEYDRDVLAGERRLCAVAGAVAVARDSVRYPAQRMYGEIFAERQPNDDVAILAIRFVPPLRAEAVAGAARADGRSEGASRRLP